MEYEGGPEFGYRLDVNPELYEDLAANRYPYVMDDPKPAVTVTAFKESSIEILFAVWCRQENYIQVRDEMQERIRNGFLDNEIEIPVPKMGLIDRPQPLANDEIDQYANQKALKREGKES